MIEGYYEARGLDENGSPQAETRVELGLDIFVQPR